MAVTASHIEEKLRSHLEPQHFEIEDTSGGCGAKYAVIIVSEKFVGKPLLQRHRMVNEIMEEELKSIHAFQMKTLTPEQWEKRNSK